VIFNKNLIGTALQKNAIDKHTFIHDEPGFQSKTGFITKNWQFVHFMATASKCCVYLMDEAKTGHIPAYYSLEFDADQ